MKFIKQFKELCVACGSQSNRMNKEHPFPRWLISRTGTDKTSIKWLGGKRIPAHQATLPICKNCNDEFGAKLESPMSRILTDIENGRGISDNEAEIVVRWLWKIDGLLWHVDHPTRDYSTKFKLRERVLLPLDQIRGHLILALALFRNVDPTYGDLPMGIDSEAEIDGIFVSGVFSKTAMMVVYEPFAHLIPKCFSRYRMQAKRDLETADAKLFYPNTSFDDDTEAVGITKQCSIDLTAAHEAFALEINKRHTAK